MRINSGHATKHRKNSINETEETVNAEHADYPRENKTEKNGNLEGWLCQGWLLGNGRNTVSRVLLRRRELTEPH